MKGEFILSVAIAVCIMLSVLLVTKEAVFASKGYPFKNILYIINVLYELMVSNFIIDIFIIYIIQDNALIDSL